MTRDMDLVRTILMEIEQHQYAAVGLDEAVGDGLLKAQRHKRMSGSQLQQPYLGHLSERSWRPCCASAVFRIRSAFGPMPCSADNPASDRRAS